MLPELRPFTIPPEVTVATLVLEENQGVVEDGVPDPVRTVELFIQVLSAPLILGKAFTVKFAVAIQPFVFV